MYALIPKSTSNYWKGNGTVHFNLNLDDLDIVKGSKVVTKLHNFWAFKWPLKLSTACTVLGSSLTTYISKQTDGTGHRALLGGACVQEVR